MKKFSVIGGSEHEDWFYHAEARDLDQLVKVVLAALVGGWPHVFEGHLQPASPNNANNDPASPNEFYLHVKLEHTNLKTMLISDRYKGDRLINVREAMTAKIETLSEYLAWYEANHTVPRENT